ncbi:redoxin domain-containing protein [Halovenus rubra]|uniref:Redoxin domain-containing protein n=2 Tax=Halovenus rubra TaxID=869890 RepID=A0ACC7E350_9EURY|nr:redoxin domain-containing protein [Halovenus rubra]
MVTVGEKAPDFVAPALIDGEGTAVELFKQIRTHEATVLYFYPADFVPECTAELLAVQQAGWADEDEIAVIALSGDSLFSHAAYAAEFELTFTLVSDFHASVAESYDLRMEKWEGHIQIPLRASVVIGSDWEVRAVEPAKEPLARTTPAPIERAGEVLRSEGLDVTQPTVDYADCPDVP